MPPVVSQAQRGLFELVKHNPEKARKLGFKVPQKVASEFLKDTPDLHNKALPEHAKRK